MEELHIVSQFSKKCNETTSFSNLKNKTQNILKQKRHFFGVKVKYNAVKYNVLINNNSVTPDPMNN